MKRLFNLVLVFFVALLFVSCDLLEDDSKSGPKAPDMGGPENLPIYGVTRSPATITECNDMFLDVVAAIQDGVITNSTVTTTTAPNLITSFNMNGNRSSSRALETNHGLISWIVGNSINVTGSEIVDIFQDNRLISSDPNYVAPYGNYDPAISVDVVSNVSGTFYNASLSNAFNNYTVSGNVIRNVKSSYKQGGNISATSITAYVRLNDEKVIGSALSIVREDGLGAKFIFSYADAYGFAGNENTLDSEIDAYHNGIDNTVVEVKVYDLNNQHIFTSFLTLAEVGA